MPTIEVKLRDLQKLVRRKITIGELKQRGILYVKGEIEEDNGNELKLDIKDVNRPDLWSVEGIARELKGHYRIEKGLAKFQTSISGLKVKVDEKAVNAHGKTVCAVVKGLEFNDETIKQLVQLQEKITQTYGRNRAAASLGIYNYDRIKGPIDYTTTTPEGIKFAPLEFKEAMTPKEILERHPKGQKYRHLLEGKRKYPVFIDSEKRVLSMPPIINSNYTGRVDEETKNVFIEVTGPELEIISLVLNVIATVLAERGGKIETVDVVYDDKTLKTPMLEPKKISINADNCRKLIGIDISDTEIVRLLNESRMDAKKEGKQIKVKYPAYRPDILHERDIIEDVAIAFGYNDIEPEEPKIHTVGQGNKQERFQEKVREICIGLGVQEVLSYMLSDKDAIFKKMNVEEGEIVEIENPISSRWSVFRNSLLPKSLEFLSRNTHIEYPQKIFETGNIVVLDNRGRAIDKKSLCIMLADNSINYQDAASYLDALLRNLGLEYSLKEKKDKRFIEGRCAGVFVKNKEIGIIGEIHPLVLENFSLSTPCAGFEISLEELNK